MNRNQSNSSTKEDSRFQQICEIVELLELIKSRIEKLPTNQEKDVKFEDIIKDLEESISLAKSVRYQMLSKGRIPVKAFNRLLENLKLLESYAEIFI